MDRLTAQNRSASGDCVSECAHTHTRIHMRLCSTSEDQLENITGGIIPREKKNKARPTQ